MPTIDDIKFKLEEYSIAYSNTMKKTELLHLLGDKVDLFDFVDFEDGPTNEIRDKSIKGFIMKKQKYYKASVYEEDKLYIGTFINDKKDAILVKGQSKSGRGVGLGKGGAKWTWSMSEVL